MLGVRRQEKNRPKPARATTLPRTFGNCEDCDSSTVAMKGNSCALFSINCKKTLRNVISAPANKARRVGATWKTQ